MPDRLPPRPVEEEDEGNRLARLQCESPYMEEIDALASSEADFIAAARRSKAGGGADRSIPLRKAFTTRI